MHRRLTAAVNLKINVDWAKTINLLETSLAIVKTKPELITSQYKYSDYGYHYEISNRLNVAKVTNGSPDLHAINGPLVANTMPWVNKLLNDMAPMKPMFFTFNRLILEGREHIDQAGMLCAINYFVNTTTANTFVKDGEYEESYPTIQDTCWLLDIQKLHRIDYSDTIPRYWFNVRFGESFDFCRDWFQEHTNLAYSN